MEKSTAFVGLDVHKESIEVAVAQQGQASHYGRFGGTAAAVDQIARKLGGRSRELRFVYEAGPCGFWIYRRLRRKGYGCMVVSPSMTPRRAGDRVKTDRRDCLNLARLAYAGQLDPIYVPDERDEAIRDLVRAREDVVCVQRQARQRLQALLLRNEIRYAGKTAWSVGHRRWLAKLKLPDAAQQIAFEEYVQSIEEAEARLQRLAQVISVHLETWRWKPLVDALQAFRGIKSIHGVRIVAELGDLTRFASPRKLMGYLGLIPSENSSGTRHRQGAITKSGNRSARRPCLLAPRTCLLGNRSTPRRDSQGGARRRVESATSPLRTLSQALRSRREPQQGHRGDCPRALRIRLVCGPDRQTSLELRNY
jgi:transposase